MKNILAVILIGTAFGCQNIKPVDDNISYYYNLDSLINEQQMALQTIKPMLNKRARITNDSSQNSFTPDSLSWSNELNIFKEANINIPVLQGLYQSEVRDDDRSNLKIKEFTPVEDQNLKVSFLRIYYLDNIQNIRKLEAKYVEDNPIYHSGKDLRMVFEDINGKPMLSKYTIHGSQKMILQDTVSFEIEGMVRY